jgi:hypothetical protein
MTIHDELRIVFAKKARSGDAGYAIAWSLLGLADTQAATAKALQCLGNGNASTDFGAIENLAIQIAKIADVLSEK